MVAASVVGNPWTFTGRRLDGETGLMYYRARMFDTGLGRFVGRDPIESIENKSMSGYFGQLVKYYQNHFSSTIYNLKLQKTDYIYCLGNPATHLDAIGLKVHDQFSATNQVKVGTPQNENCDCGNMWVNATLDASFTKTPSHSDPVISGNPDYVGGYVNFQWSPLKNSCCCENVGWKQWVWWHNGSWKPDTKDNKVDPQNGWYSPGGSPGMNDFAGMDFGLADFKVGGYFKAQLLCKDDTPETVLYTIEWMYIVESNLTGSKYDGFIMYVGRCGE